VTFKLLGVTPDFNLQRHLADEHDLYGDRCLRGLVQLPRRLMGSKSESFWLWGA